jgi:acetoin utilization protein AcuC
VLVTQDGCDSHLEDPLAHLTLTVDGQRAAYLALHDLAHELTGGRWVATGGGGYALVSVVPRAWTHLLAIVAGQPLSPDTDTPEGWRDHVRTSLGRTPPYRMTDGRNPAWRDWAEGHDPETWLDRSIAATRSAAFPLHGMDPYGMDPSAY